MSIVGDLGHFVSSVGCIMRAATSVVSEIPFSLCGSSNLNAPWPISWRIVVMISSRTPEGDKNCCSLCGKEVVLEPSTFPTQDAPCPHCGHLLWFDDAHSQRLDPPPVCTPRLGPEIRSTSYLTLVLEVGEKQFGVPSETTLASLREQLDLLTAQNRLPQRAEVHEWVIGSSDWLDFSCRLERQGKSSRPLGWFARLSNFLRGDVKRVPEKIRS